MPWLKRIARTIPLLGLATASGLLFGSQQAAAGVADSPLPSISGKPTHHLFTLPGYDQTAAIATVIACTSMETVNNMSVGVEFFGAAGGAPLNDVSAGNGSLTIVPGYTVYFTTSAVDLSSDVTVSLANGTHGAARVVATSSKLICSAFEVLDFYVSGLRTLKVVKAKRQGGD